MTTVSKSDAVGVTDTRERILKAAYPLFAQRGIREVSIDEILDGTSVTSEMFSHHFDSKDELAAAFLQRREREWTIGMIEAGARARGESPEEILLAIFDVFEHWFTRDDYEACTFINVLLEMGSDHPLGIASTRHLMRIRDMVARMADDAGLNDPGAFALSFHILMKGSIISAVEGDHGAARRAKAMASLLIKEFTPAVRALPVLQGDSATSADEWAMLDEDFATVSVRASMDEAFRSFRDDTNPDLW